jgi:hypothetical protein
MLNLYPDNNIAFLFGKIDQLKLLLRFYSPTYYVFFFSTEERKFLTVQFQAF